MLEEDGRLLWPDLKSHDEMGILNQAPTTQLEINLPKLKVGKYNEDRQTKWVRSGIHEDLTHMLIREIASWKQRSREKILIQGRMLTEEMWDKMENKDEFMYFYRGRDHRSKDSRNKKSIITKILPKELIKRISPEEVRRLATLIFDPSSLSEEIGHEVV